MIEVREPPRRRPKEPTPRLHATTVRFSDAEQALIDAAASQAGQAAGAWLAGSALAAAQAAAIPGDAEYQISWADGQVSWYGPDLMPAAVAALSEPLGNLEPGESVTITRIRKGANHG